jgi:hypothetical protein
MPEPHEIFMSNELRMIKLFWKEVHIKKQIDPLVSDYVNLPSFLFFISS